MTITAPTVESVEGILGRYGHAAAIPADGIDGYYVNAYEGGMVVIARYFAFADSQYKEHHLRYVLERYTEALEGAGYRVTYDAGWNGLIVRTWEG